VFYAAATGLPLALSVLRASLRYTVLLGAMETVCGKVESASMLPRQRLDVMEEIPAALLQVTNVTSEREIVTATQTACLGSSVVKTTASDQGLMTPMIAVLNSSRVPWAGQPPRPSASG